MQSSLNLKNDKCYRRIKRLLAYVGITVACVLAVNLLAASYMKTEQTVYYWDTSAYWQNSIDLLGAFKESFKEGLSLLLESLSSDYNYLPIVPLLPILAILGIGRTVFILTILNVYLVPAAIIFAYAATLLFKSSRKHKNREFLFYATSLLVSLFMPSMLAPVFDGRIDAISMLVVSLIFLLYVKTRFQKLRHNILLGVLLCSALIFRRYYSYWVLGFFVAYALTSAYGAWVKSRNNKTGLGGFWELIKKPAMRLAVAGCTMVATMLIFFKDLFIRYLTVDYSDIYSAYYLGGFFNQILLFIYNFGLILIVPMAIVFIIALRQDRSKELYWVSLFILIQGIIIFLAFTRTQTFGVHHYYMLTPVFLWVLYFSLGFILSGKTKAKTSWILASSFVCCVGGLSLFSFVGQRSATGNLLQQTFLGATRVISPVVRHDLIEVRNLASFLATEMKSSDYVYVLSSSDNFNDGILMNIYLPETISFNMSGVAHVDKRDGFPNYIFDAQYILVADPVQTHLEAGSQDVIAYMAQMILDGQASNLEKIKEFYIDNGVTLKLYRKNSTYDTALIENIRAHFQKKYPTYPDLNNIHLLVEPL